MRTRPYAPRQTFTYRQSLFFLAGVAFVFCLLLLFGYVIQISSGPGSDGNVTCNGQPMSTDEVCEHFIDNLDEGSFTYDQQAQYQANLRAQAYTKAQGFGVGAGVTGGIGVILLLWGLSIKKEPSARSSMASSSTAKRGDDITQPFEVTLAEAYTGATRMLHIQSKKACSVCRGTGKQEGSACATCLGQSWLAYTKQIQVTVPAGVDNTSKIRLAGEGQPGTLGGARGDLFLVISVKPDPLFERKGDDLYTDLTVESVKARFGGEIPVRLPNERTLLLTIPDETPNGRVLRLTGKGMPKLRGEGNGNLFVRIHVLPS